MLSYTYHFYNQTDIYFAMKIAPLWRKSGISWCSYDRNYEPIRKWSLVAKLNLAEVIK